MLCFIYINNNKKSNSEQQMGDQISCCDSKAQLDNTANGFTKISTTNALDHKQLKFSLPEMSSQMRSLVRKAQKSKYFKAKTNTTNGQSTRMKDTLVFNADSSKALYQGEVSQNVADGYGTVSFPNGSFFEGSFNKGQPVNGIFAFNDKCYYVGDIQRFQASGDGAYQNIENGYYYQGQWKKNLQHGAGIQKYANGDYYQGKFMCGSKFGQGEYKFADGKNYKGSFYNGHSDGHGLLILPNGDSYDGEWKLGQMHGAGTYKWKNGQKYVGEYVNGARQNKGKYYFASGACYDGEWANGVQQGQGKIVQGYDQVSGRWQAGQKVN